jgi:hypothetical protein
LLLLNKAEICKPQLRIDVIEKMFLVSALMRDAELIGKLTIKIFLKFDAARLFNAEFEKSANVYSLKWATAEYGDSLTKIKIQFKMT